MPRAEWGRLWPGEVPATPTPPWHCPMQRGRAAGGARRYPGPLTRLSPNSSSSTAVLRALLLYRLRGWLGPRPGRAGTLAGCGGTGDVNGLRRGGRTRREGTGPGAPVRAALTIPLRSAAADRRHDNAPPPPLPWQPPRGRGVPERAHGGGAEAGRPRGTVGGRTLWWTGGGVCVCVCSGAG